MCVVPIAKDRRKKWWRSGGQSERERGGGGVGIFLTYPTKNMNESMLTFSRVHTLTCWGIKKAKTHTANAGGGFFSLSYIFLHACAAAACVFLRRRTKEEHMLRRFCKKEGAWSSRFLCCLRPLTLDKQHESRMQFLFFSLLSVCSLGRQQEKC